MATTEFPYKVSTIETIDGAMLDYFKDMNVHVVGNKGWKKIPTIWVSAERSYQSKHNKDLRDGDGSFDPALDDRRKNGSREKFDQKRQFLWEHSARG